jgi:hypothetical protein
MLHHGSQGGENVVLVVTGANISPEVLQRAIAPQSSGAKC